MDTLYVSKERELHNLVRFRCDREPYVIFTELSTGFVQVIEGEGMPVFESSDHGDLFVEYNVVLPIEISSQTRRSTSLSFPRVA